MLVKIQTVFALALVLTLTPAAAAPYVLEVPGPCLVVLETQNIAGLLVTEDPHQTLRPVILEASPSHLVLAIDAPGVLVFDNPENTEVVATLTRVRITEHEILPTDGGHAIARSFYPVAFETKEEDHDIDPAPKAAGRPLLTVITSDNAISMKEEDHDIDPAPKHGSTWAADWVLASAAVAELGPGWYFVGRSGEVAYEVVVEER